MPKTKGRIGFHLSGSESEFEVSKLQARIDALTQLGADWVLLKHDPASPLPREILTRLSQAGLSPIVQLTAQVTALPAATFNPIAYALAEIGVRHVIAFDQPNMRQSWPAGQWDQNRLVERYLDASLPLLQSSLSAGLIPTVAPLAPAGDYWDTAFLRDYLKGMARRTGSELVSALHLSAYAWAKGRSLEWGLGGPVAWPAARPYYTPEDSQDHLGVNISDWYAAIAESSVGIRLPILILGGGATREEEDKDQTNGEIAKALRIPSKFSGVRAFCFDSIPPVSMQATWSAASTISKSVAASTSAHDGEKRIDHYVLLPGEESLALRAWRQATAFAVTKRPTVGFDPAEASHARKVTLVGDELAIPAAIEASLAASGCQVQRMSFLPASKSSCKRAEPGEQTSIASVQDD